MSDSLWLHGLSPTRLLHPWNFLGKSTGVGCHFLFQRIFPTQGSNLGLLHCRQTLYHLSHQGSLYPVYWALIRYMIYKYFLPFWGFYFQFLDSVFWKIFNLRNAIYVFFFGCLCIWGFVWETTTKSSVTDIYTYNFFSKSFVLLAIKFRSQFILNWLLYMVWNLHLTSFISCGYSCPRTIH